MKKAYGLIVALLLLAPIALNNARAQDTLRAAAVVNDDVISVLDLSLRTRLAIASIGAKDSPEIRQRLTPQVLRALIDERLQLQEAKRLSLEPTEQEVEEAFAAIAQGNNMSPEQFTEVLRQNNVLPTAVKDQARAELAWRGVVERRIRRQITISNEQIGAEIERLKGQDGQLQYRIAELFLSVDNPGDEARVSENIARLADEIRKGTPFQAVAKQFSQSSTASVGGDLGWVTLDQIDPAVARAVQGLQKNGLAGPIRGTAGYYIVGLIDQRTFRLGEQLIDTRAIALPVRPGTSAEVIEQRMAQLAAIQPRIESCTNLQTLAKEAGEDAVVRDTGRQRPQDLPPDVARAIEGVAVGQASAPFRRADALIIAVVCGRDSSGIDRKRVEERLVQEQIELRARRYLRDLRRSADLDIRI